MSKPRIVICGQKPRRHEEIERAVGSRAKIAFWAGPQENVRLLVDRVRNADAVFVCIAATAHEAVKHIKENVASARIYYVNGATSGLIDSVELFLKEAGGPC